MDDNLPDLEPPDLEPIDLSVGTPPTVAVSNTDGWAPGWYADPWTAGQYRYWTGRTGPVRRTAGGRRCLRSMPGARPIRGRRWGRKRAVATAGRTRTETATGTAAPSPRRGPMIVGVIALVIVLLIAGVVGYAINSSSQPSSESVTPVPVGARTTTPTNPGPTTPSGQPIPSDPDSSALSGLVVKQSDVGPARTVVLIPDGNQLTEPTLDLCNGTYASETLRAARLQVADVDTTGLASLSTEAVLYRDPGRGRAGIRGVAPCDRRVPAFAGGEPGRW